MNRSYLLALNLIVWLALLSAVQCWISDLNIDEDFTLRDSEFFTSSNRIVGGRNAEEGEFPSYVSLRFINRSTPHLYNYCGGVLISRRLILTAAHCVSNHPTDINAARTIMHPGKWNNYNVNMMRVDRICYDKRYSGLKSLALDFGLLRLRDDADIDESQIAKLPTEPIKNRQKGLNVGIGVVGSKNNKLVKADQLKVLKVEQTKCPSKWKVIHYSHVCFKSTADDKGNSCRGKYKT